ncbi:TetR/AcrR family transcriptional regulator [Amphritea sp.]|uniref:TetR/AcrR family transcriptional regulator n=1 Tax=Amphritea sp. TaxID=1872502 RepID=UPI0025C736D2|nr:TetR/AcrR family transcriptional regulator [Amphritea sp.]
MSDKRLQLVITAFKLFYSKGVHAVGINEILSESGVAKKTLYHHFSGKEELVSAVLEFRDQRFHNWLKSRLDQATPGPDKVGGLFDALDDWFNDRVDELLPFHGCFFINVSAEFSEPNNLLHQLCCRHKERVAQLIRTQVETLDLEPVEVNAFTNALCLLKEGAVSLAHVQGDRLAAIKAKATALQLLQGNKSVRS